MRSKRLDGLLLHLGNALVVLALLYGGLDAFLSAHFYEYSRGELLAVCALASALSVGLCAWRHGGWAALGLLAALALAREPLWEKLLEPAVDMFRSAGTRRAALPLLLLLAGVLALLLGWLVVRARCWYLCALVVTLPVLPPIVEGVLPEWTALLLSAAGWGTLLLTALLPRDRRLWRAQLASLAGMGLFLALLTAALPREGYLRPDWATNARDKLISAAAGGFSGALDWELPAGDLTLDIGGGQRERPDLRPVVSFGGGAGSAVERGRVDLRAAGPRTYSQRQIMTVVTDQPDPAGTAFLLGGTAAVYTGESWEEAEPWAGASPDLLPAGTALDVPSAGMTITLNAGGGSLFTPYRLDREPPASVGRQYALSYRPGGPEDGFAPLEGPLAEMEEDYRSYVYENYLSVPAGLQTRLAPILGDMERMPADPRLPEAYRETVAAALATARCLSGLAEYDLDVPAMEPGEDFVERFLDMGRGYCVHFATTGVLLLRMQNIPARYASGYLAHLDGSGRAAVLDSNAHAWAEIYLDGYGWYPVEMTPGGGTGSAGQEDGPGEDGQEEARPPQTTQTPQQTQRPETPQPDRSPTETPGGEDAASASPQEDAEAPREPLDLTWLRRALEVLALPAALAGLYALALACRRCSREDGDRNRSVIRAYGRYRRLRAWGCGEDELLEELARKARFSQHILTEEERAAAWARLEELGQGSGLPAWRRRILRLLRPLM